MYNSVSIPSLLGGSTNTVVYALGSYLLPHGHQGARTSPSMAKTCGQLGRCAEFCKQRAMLVLRLSRHHPHLDAPFKCDLCPSSSPDALAAERAGESCSRIHLGTPCRRERCSPKSEPLRGRVLSEHWPRGLGAPRRFRRLPTFRGVRVEGGATIAMGWRLR